MSAFRIDIESDVIAATGDGASVMKYFGSKAPFEYITCMNHTVNLAVLEVIFPKAECCSDEELCEENDKAVDEQID